MCKQEGTAGGAKEHQSLSGLTDHFKQTDRVEPDSRAAENEALHKGLHYLNSKFIVELAQRQPQDFKPGQNEIYN